MHNVRGLSIFYRKTTKSKRLEFSDKEKDTLNKKKIIKLEVLKRWQSDYKTKNSPKYRTAEICFTVVLLSMRF